MVLLAEGAAAAGTDPLALIIGGGAACIATLSMLVWSLLLARVSRIERDTKETAGHLSGSEGMTVRLGRAEERIRALELAQSGTLSRERFEQATADQNRRLETLDKKVDQVDQVVRRPSFTTEGGATGAPRPGPYKR